MNWSPVIDDAVAARVAGAVERVATDLEQLAPDSVADAGLAGGSAGLAVFFAELAAAGRPGAADRAMAHLDVAANAVADRPMHPSLYGGFMGVAWAVEFLEKAAGERSEENPNEGIEEVLLDHLATSPWRRDYDLISGLVGFGVYALSRAPGPFASAALGLTLTRLEELALATPNGATWFTPPDLLPEHQVREYGPGYYNMGLAHGVPGVVGFLAGCCAANVEGERARPLLRAALEWVLAQRLPAESTSTFPAILPLSGTAGGSRQAWCYGDPGVAVQLLRAATALGDDALAATAVDVMRRSAQVATELTGVRDAGICHGSAGLALIHARLFQQTGDGLFRAAAAAWVTDTIERQTGAPLGGFPKWTEDGMEPDAGVLTGSAGVALVLMALASDREPRWDQFLMLGDGLS